MNHTLCFSVTYHEKSP